MDLTFVDHHPDDVVKYDAEPVDISERMTPDDVKHVAEIFNTPLTGTYNWDYSLQDDRIKKLYELGKQLNWNAQTDIQWELTPDFQDRDSPTEAENLKRLETAHENFPFANYEPYKALSVDRKIEFHDHVQSWFLSQFLHGEQGALLVASQLVSCAPTYNAKLYASSQAFDEARHVEVFNKYIQTKLGMMYPVNDSLKALLDKILSDERWDLKFIGMQIIIEGMALAAFNVAKMGTKDKVFRQVLEYVIRDEARHVTYGVNYLESHVKSLSQQEIEDRAEFALEACIVMKDRMIPLDVHRRFGWNTEETREISLGGKGRQEFRNLVFARVVPNLKRIGLLTDNIRAKFDAIGLLDYENLPDDGTIDWADLERPLQETSA